MSSSYQSDRIVPLDGKESVRTVLSELEVISKMDEWKPNLNLFQVNNEYYDYDAENKDYIVEVKTRNKYYKKKVIEMAKISKNYQHAQILGKQFIYAVSDSRGLWIWNISKLMAEIVENQKPYPMKAPQTTKFGKDKKIIKYTYELNEIDAQKL